MVEHSPKIHASEEEATATQIQELTDVTIIIIIIFIITIILRFLVFFSFLFFLFFCAIALVYYLIKAYFFETVMQLRSTFIVFIGEDIFQVISELRALSVLKRCSGY